MFLRRCSPPLQGMGSLRLLGVLAVHAVVQLGCLRSHLRLSCPAKAPLAAPAERFCMGTSCCLGCIL